MLSKVGAVIAIVHCDAKWNKDWSQDWVAPYGYECKCNDDSEWGYDTEPECIADWQQANPPCLVLTTRAPFTGTTGKPVDCDEHPASNCPACDESNKDALCTGNFGSGTCSGHPNQCVPSDAFVVTRTKLEEQRKSATMNDANWQYIKNSLRLLPEDEWKEISLEKETNPPNVKLVQDIMEKNGGWEYLVPKADSSYNYLDFLKGVGKFPAFCGKYYKDNGDEEDVEKTLYVCRNSLAVMFAHFAQETGEHNIHSDIPEWRQGLKWVREMGLTEDDADKYGECDTGIWQGEKYPCGKFTEGRNEGHYKSYFGRGAKQLSYNYNYGAFSEILYGNVSVLLEEPERVADTWLNIASAVFFYLYPQPPKPSMLQVIDGFWKPNNADIDANRTEGFGVTIMIINGGVECGGNPEHAAAQNRIDYYNHTTKFFEVEPKGDRLGCKEMKEFDHASSGATKIYWEQDYSWNPANPGEKSYKCSPVGYQTPYSTLIESDYEKCIMHFFNNTVIIEE